MANFCKCKIGVLHMCYLGIPLGAGLRRVATWEVVIEKFRKKLSGWKCRSMSWAARIVLINSVLSSLPIYFMSLFQAPKTIIKRIDKIRRNFLWGGLDGKRKMVKVSWKQICSPKEKGGAGVVNLEIKNKALLAKWRWRLEVDKKALWSKVILDNYGTNVTRWRFSANKLKDMSTIWRRIVENSLDARVPLLDRESGILFRLIDRVSDVVLVPEVEDRILWAHDNKRGFLVK
ncbi:putative Transposon TX1 [Gossypium australe]|uniref:Putative Transposon TX1 n=1 Tax=Gossypium australe TaxID=47621 RepID=A0A5B6V114_9ROSI|nr:putative Transposon TX1 [Gossypium australe]